MASTSMDPLRILRNTLASKGSIHLLASEDPSSSPVYTLHEATHLSFPASTSDNNNTTNDARIVLHKATPTRFKRTVQSTAEETWDLQSLLLCYLKKDANIAEYAQEAVKEGCELVGIMQRRIVADYLEGKDATNQAGPYLVSDPSAAAALAHARAAQAIPAERNDAADRVIDDTAAEVGITTTNGEALPQPASLAAAAPTTTTRPADTSAIPAAVAPESGRPAKKTRYVVNKEDLEVCKKIASYWEPIQISDRTTVLRGTVKKANFANVREMIADRLKSSKEQTRKGGHSSSSGHHHGASSSSTAAMASSTIPTSVPSARRRRQANPIIIISPSSSAIITMFNVKRFLEESIFEPSDVARASAGRIAEDVVQINHKRQIGSLSGDSQQNLADNTTPGGLAGQNRAERGMAGEKLVRYFVVDGVDALSKFGDDAWDRVVCVMTTGQEWQFRPYKWSEPKELFHHVKGIYPKFTNEPSNPKISNWNVSELRIDPAKRHIDKSTVSDFWRSLEAWTSIHKQGIVDF